MRPHGSGKTTLATAILSSIDNQIEFVNADIIAAELNPNNVDAAAIQASRLMLERINTLSRQGRDFAFETTHQAELGKSSKTTICAYALRSPNFR